MFAACFSKALTQASTIQNLVSLEDVSDISFNLGVACEIGACSKCLIILLYLFIDLYLINAYDQ